MSKERKIIYTVALFVLMIMLYFRYSPQKSDPVEKTSITIPSEEMLEIEEYGILGETAEEVNSESGLPEVVEKEDSIFDSEETSENIDTSAKVEKTAVSEERRKLIGGAAIEWIEPKPKDLENPFGEPPF